MAHMSWHMIPLASTIVTRGLNLPIVKGPNLYLRIADYESPYKNLEKFMDIKLTVKFTWILHRKIYIQSVKKLFVFSITYVFHYLSI